MNVSDHDAAALREAVRQMETNGSPTRGRSGALERFLAHGLPSTAEEDWRYTDLAEAARRYTEFTAKTATSARGHRHAKTTEFPQRLTGQSIRLTFLNGRFRQDLSEAILPAGVRIDLQSHAGDERRPIAMSLDQDSSAPLRDLNAAFLGNPVRILVPDGLHIEQPIELLWITQPTELTSGRVEIVIGQQGSLTVVERHEGSGATLSNTLMVAHCQEGSAFRYFKLQMESMEAVHLAQQHVRAERASHIELFHLDRGAQLARNDLRVSLAGAESSLNARGLFTVSGAQHSDNHVRIDHLAERTTSHAVYRGIADGNARAVFSGKILVQSGASGANARLGNQNLLLTPNAEIDSTPALEIYADDVKCSHGSTTGQLDQAALFYLRSRGIAEQEARQMLVEAFAAEIITQLPEHPLRDPLLALLRSGARASFAAGDMQ